MLKLQGLLLSPPSFLPVSVPEKRVHATQVGHSPNQLALFEPQLATQAIPSCKYSNPTRRMCQPVKNDELDPRKTCCICYLAYSTVDDAELRVQLPCGHYFGATCIARWMSTKKTCPLCRYELFPAEDLGDHGYNPWLDEYDPPLQTSGVSQEYDFVFTHPAIPEFSWEEATISELGLSSAHSSTATRRYFEAYSETHVTPRRRVRETNTRRPGLRKVSTPCREDEDIWITLFSDEEQKLDPPACEDIWVTFLDDDDDDDLVLPHFPSEHSLFIFDHRKIVPDTMFDDLLANHMHWMGDMDGEDELQVYDVFDYLV